jgi:glycosyltransferase involved in cell wall biosynthesis
VSGRRHASPTVYYLAPHIPSPSGGVRNIYRHVDTLQAAGIDAAVVHARTGFRCTWFANDTRVLNASDVRLGGDDILVVPECYGPGLHALPDGPRVVIFNQGAYHTFDLIAPDASTPGAPYAGARGVIALLTVSTDSAELLRYTFPDRPVRVARIVVDPEVFRPANAVARRRIAYMTHRRREEREQLHHILRTRRQLAGWQMTPIVGRTERETAELMRHSAVFLSFSQRDGFGLPPAEAMASGCYVVGYHGQGGREYFDPAYCSPVSDGDLVGFARAVERACGAYDADPEVFGKLGRAASDAVRATYSPAGLRDDLLAFYGPLLAGRAA